MGCNMGRNMFPEGERAAFGDHGLKKEWWSSARVPIFLKGEMHHERFRVRFRGLP